MESGARGRGGEEEIEKKKEVYVIGVSPRSRECDGVSDSQFGLVSYVVGGGEKNQKRKEKGSATDLILWLGSTTQTAEQRESTNEWAQEARLASVASGVVRRPTTDGSGRRAPKTSYSCFMFPHPCATAQGTSAAHWPATRLCYRMIGPRSSEDAVAELV